MNSTSRGLAVFMLTYLMLSIESPLLVDLHLSYFAPDLAVIVVVWVALHMNTVSGSITCFLLGFLKDGFVMGVPVGMHMEIFVIIFFLVRYFAGKVLVRGLPTLMITVFVISLLASCLFALLSLLFDRNFTDYGLVFRLLVPVALVTAPFAPGVFYVLDRADGVFNRQRDTLFS